MTLLLLFFPLVTLSSAKDFWTVSTSLGSVRGRAVTSDEKQRGYAFLGIPFAAPPLGDLRFKGPVSPEPWTGTFDGSSYKSGCLQSKLFPSRDSFSEDCLYLNVFSSATCLEKGGCPVLFYIHGGSRLYGSAAAIPVEAVVNNFANEERDIVVVTIQYRLGILGWINLAPDQLHSSDTNIGLRDILFALNWTHREILHFGADATRVTLMGQSSGAQMINEIALSGLADGLYHQILTMSAPHFGERNRYVNRQYSQKFAEKLGCRSGLDVIAESSLSLERILKCLRTKSQQELLETQTSFDAEVEEIFGTWVDGEGGVFPRSIEEQLRRRQPNVTALIGTTSAEFPDTLFLDKNGSVRMDMLDDVCAHVGYEQNYENPERFRRICSEHYSNETRVLSYNDDYMYYHPSALFANWYGQTRKVFVYSFDYNPVKASHMGRHATDLEYIFGREPSPRRTWTDRDRHIQRIHSGMFANFIRTGDPSYGGEVWSPWSSERRSFMSIDFDANATLRGMADGYRSEASRFYEQLVPRDAGQRRLTASLPPKNDIFMQSSMVYSILHYWTKAPLLLGKKSGALMEMKSLWTDHVRQLRTLRIPIATTGSSDGFTLLVVCLLSTIMSYILMKTYYDWRRRRQYLVIDGCKEI